MIVCGIDYGNKLAGTTVLACLDTAVGIIHFSGSKKREDADKFVYQTITIAKPDYVFIDAPLSLPGVYTHKGDYSNYFFRQADKQLRAMSPMFLGGLTARAMKLKKELEAISIPVYETYPAAQAARIGLSEEGYKKDAAAIPRIIYIIRQQLTPFIVDNSVIFNWHQVDALLALIGAVRFINNQHEVYGNEQEGLIIV